MLTGAPSITTSATSASPVGTYTLSVSAGTLAAANYSFTYTAGSLTITQAPLTITANNLSMTLGGTPPALTGSISGIMNGDAITYASGGVTDELLNPVTLSSSTPAGLYILNPGYSDPSSLIGNYTVTDVQGTLTVS